jgi:hypothetical protein
MKRETDQFVTEVNGGRLVRVIEFKDLSNAETFKGSGVQKEGITSYQTADGQPLNVLCETEFQVRLTGEILRRVSG